MKKNRATIEETMVTDIVRAKKLIGNSVVVIEKTPKIMVRVLYRTAPLFNHY